MTHPIATRRTLLGGAAALAAFGRAQAAAPPALPKEPVTLNVIDVAGQLQLTQRAMEDFAKANPKLVAKIGFSQAPAPELPGKLKAQQAAGRVDIDLVLTGTDAMSAGIDQGLWVPMVNDYATALPDLNAIYQPGALKMQGLAQGQAVCVVYCPAGPLLEYMPDAVKTPPKTAQELLDWTRAHPKRFVYARPANSGPGRTFLQGLPYLLGDADPKDPKDGWAKTWEYLVELGKNIEYYPTGTGATMKELGEGSRDMIVTMTGWDINPRILGVVPKEAEVAVLQGFHWVTDAQYMAVPKGVSQEKLAVLLQLISYVLSKPAQATTWDKGYFYPGPAVKDVPLSMAPQESQDAIKEFNRPFYDKLIAEVPSETPLPADKLVYAFQRWDQQVGARVGK
ncbi:MAG: extracellular solute-binding protein [Proteobacteria bacterium]|nr:extracellular solute-binding protein [Pseudomonadota bacterium]